MELNAYTVASPSGISIGDEKYDHGAILYLSTASAKYLLLSGSLVRGVLDVVPSGNPAAPVPVTETNTTLDLTVSGKETPVTIAGLINLFPRLQPARGESGPQGPAGPQGAAGPAGPSVTINGKAGASITLTKADLDLDRIANLAPEDMPVSTAQARAIQAAIADLLSSQNGTTSVDVTTLAAIVAQKAAQSDLVTHVQSRSNPHGVTKAQIGLSNVVNLAPADMPVSMAQSDADDQVLSAAATDAAVKADAAGAAAISAAANDATAKASAAATSAINSAAADATAKADAAKAAAISAAAADAASKADAARTAAISSAAADAASKADAAKTAAISAAGVDATTKAAAARSGALSDIRGGASTAADTLAKLETISARKIDASRIGVGGGVLGLQGNGRASMLNIPVADIGEVSRGEYDNGVVTPRTARIGAKAYAAYKGRQPLNGGTAPGQKLQGAGATEWVSGLGKSFYYDDNYLIMLQGLVIDRLRVRLNKAVADGAVVTVAVLINDIGTALSVSIGGGQREAKTFKYPIQVGPDDRVSVMVSTTSNVQANTLSLNYALGTRAAQTDDPWPIYTPLLPSKVALTKPSGIDIYTEVPPWFLDVPQISDKAFLASTSYTMLCRAANGVSYNAIGITSARKISDVENNLWSFSYNGAYGAVTLNKGTSQQIILMVMHGEDKNERIGAPGSYVFKQNLVAPGVLAQDHFSGYSEDGTYSDDYAAYFAFVSVRYMASVAPNYLDGAIIDIGPVAWPESGYLKPDGTAASNGVGQPTPFLAPDGYLYIFYRDSSIVSDGMKVVRAPAAQATNPSAYRIYYRVTDNAADPANWANPSLPNGFTKETAAQFVGVPGNPGTPVSQHHYYAGRLAVAQVRGSNPPEYRAIEQYSPDGSNWFIKLLKSTDLVNYSTLAILQQGNANDPDFLNYPIMGSLYDEPPGIVDTASLNIIGTAFYTTDIVRLDVRSMSTVTP